jgi:hypothetical protein
VAPWWSWYHKLLIKNLKKKKKKFKGRVPPGSKRAAGRGALLKMPSRSTM